MEPEQLRESLSIPSMETTYFLTEEPCQCLQSPAPVPVGGDGDYPRVKFEEDEENCSTHSIKSSLYPDQST